MLFNDIASVVAGVGETLETLCSAAIGVTVSTDLGNAIKALEVVFPSLTSNLENTVNAFYALYPNSFYKLASATAVSSQATLRLFDGGESGQSSPIFPHLLPVRNVSIVIVNDNNGDVADHLPS